MQAQQQVELPLSCALHSGSGRLITRPAPPTTYDLTTAPEQHKVTVCGPGGCRPVLLHRFDVSCGNANVPWVHLAAALLNADGNNAVVRNDRMIIRRTGWMPSDSECSTELLATRGPGDQAERRFERRCRRSATRVLPIGFAPLNELGARLIKAQPAVAKPHDVPVSKQKIAAGGVPAAPVQPRQSERQPEPTVRAGNVATSDDAPVVLAPGNRNPHVSPAERWADPPPLRFPERPPPKQVTAPEPEVVVPEPEEVAVGQIEPKKAEPQVALAEAVPSEAPVNRAPLPAIEAAASQVEPPPVSEAPAEPVNSLRLVSTAGWTPSVSRTEQRIDPSNLQVLNAFSIFTDQVRNLHVEREFVILLVGLTLLWGLLSGAGWYATRARRRTAVSFSMPEPFSKPESNRQPSYPQTYPQPIGTALVAPADKMMCSELCKTAHTMLRQIETNVDNLQNVAPLRRVLQREMQHLEQFLAAVMTATPIEAEEWRRTRNRLQRIVKELHRLKDIVDGAYRCLSGIGFNGREPPRDKHEAYEMLGVNADISPKTLKKLVDALRACWHPDLAQDEGDRLVREERMKRINIAWDILSEKRAEA